MKVNFNIYRLIVLVAIIFFSCSQKNDNVANDPFVKSVIDESNKRYLHEQNMIKIWRKELYETASELNKELAKQNKKLMSEELVNQYANCLYNEIDKKYKKIDDIATMKMIKDKEFYKVVTEAVNSCGESVLKQMK